MKESPVSLESEFSRWHILTYSTFKPRRWVLFLLLVLNHSSTAHPVLCCTQGNKLGLWSDGMEERSNRKRAGRPEDVSQCRSRWGEQRKDRRVERKEEDSSPPSFFFFFFARGRGHRSSQRSVIIVAPPRSWPGKGRRRLCTRLATNPRRSSRCWWWCHRGRRISRRRRLKREQTKRWRRSTRYLQSWRDEH